MQETILVTGGAGYVGSHVVVALAAAGYAPVVLDNFANATPRVLDRLEKLAGAPIPCVRADVRDRDALRGAFRDRPFTAVVHCAGLKSGRDSEERPLACWDVNVGGAIALAEVMGEAGVATLVYGSSAAVYGQPDTLPVPESAPLRPGGVYAHTKRTGEDFLRDLLRANANWRIAILRHFKPAGAHPSGRLGETADRSSGILPLLGRIAGGEVAEFPIFGTDWPTPDGTGIRDYVHVVDVADGHVAALRYLARNPGAVTVNLGSGRGHSVLEVVDAFERACGRRITRRFAPRRAGDVASCYADPSRAESLLGWRATRDLDEICSDAWRWQQAGGRA
jgi:UDP-glucose 4-epimerase